MRTLLLWCPDWPVLAAGIVEGVDVHRPVAVLHANRVARLLPGGAGRGCPPGAAQARGPGPLPAAGRGASTIPAGTPGRSSRWSPRWRSSPRGSRWSAQGPCALAARGPSRYYGGEEAAAERLVEHAALRCGVEIQAGVADGVFAALIAARAGVIVPPGETPRFLAGMDIAALDRPDLTDLLRRLGIRTLADFAALPAGDVLARFGFDAALRPSARPR